jgi:hypothetical protein
MAQRQGDFETASRLMYGEIPSTEKALAEAAASEEAVNRSGEVLVKEEVTADDIAEVVAAWTGIPAGRLMEGETAKLLRMEDGLGQRVKASAPRSRPSPTPCGVRGPASPIPTVRPVRSCSWDRPVSARRNWPRRWPRSCSMTSGPWSAST